MKKSVKTVSLSLLTAILLIMTLFLSACSNGRESGMAGSPPHGDVPVSSADNKFNTSSSENSAPDKNSSTEKSETVTMDDALFIGDSRTVGLMDYGRIEGANFFCNVGMSVYNIHKKPVSVPNVGKVTLTELLENKRYGKIYIMLGVNEVGYEADSTVKKYSGLIDLIKEKQPDAYIFIQANLHVSKKRSDTDRVVNNTAINALNTRLSKLADVRNRIFYLDANAIFDDSEGGLSSEKSGDSAHPYAKYYIEWGSWIIRQTASLIEES